MARFLVEYPKASAFTGTWARGHKGATVLVIRAAIFDFDELLIDIEPIHHQAEALLAQECGVDPAGLEENIPKVSGRRIVDWVQDLKDVYHLPQDMDTLMARREQLMLDLLHHQPLNLMPGARHAIRLLYRAGLRLAVASSGLASYITEILSRFQLDSYFEALISGADVSRGKPDPEPYLLAARRLGVAPAECVVFEDAAIGVRAAKAAGAMCIAVPNPAAEEPQDLSPADIVLPSLGDLRLAHLGLEERVK